MKRSVLLSVVAASALSASANAYEMNLDARTMGMGGAGVASGLAGSAGNSNPALLTESHWDGEQSFDLRIAGLSARMAFDDNFLDEIDDTQNDLGNFESEAGRFLDAVDQNNEDEARDSLKQLQGLSENLINDFRRLNEQGLRFQGNGGLLSAAFPGDTWGISMNFNGNFYMFSDGDISDNDLGIFQVIRDADEDDLAQSSQDIDDVLKEIFDRDARELKNLDSSARMTLGTVFEAGMSISRSFNVNNKYLFGAPMSEISLSLTPKYQVMHTYDIVADINNFDEDDLIESEQRTDRSGVNFDFGAATTMGRQDQWRFGLITRNMIERELETNPSSETADPRVLKVEPQTTVGAAYRKESYTLTLDYDLNKVEGFDGDADQKNISAGGEYNLSNWVRLRAGARYNTASDKGPDMIEESLFYTGGLELSPGPLRVEASAIIGDKTKGGSIDVGMRF